MERFFNTALDPIDHCNYNITRFKANSKAGRERSLYHVATVGKATVSQRLTAAETA